MSIVALLPILKKIFGLLTNKWTYICLLIFVCLITILALFIENKKKDKNIIELSKEITNLSISNHLLNDNVLKLSNDIIINKSFTNIIYKIAKNTNELFFTNADDIALKLEKRQNFYFNTIMSSEAKE